MLDHLLGYAIRQAQLVITEAFDRQMSGEAITTQRFSALVLIGANPGLKQTDLADIMGIARSGALAILDNLLRRGLVETRSIVGDRRARGLYLSEHGKLLHARLRRRVVAHDQAVTARLSAPEKQQLRALLGRIGNADEADRARLPASRRGRKIQP